ncbi:MAG: aldolase/citrate lyase family protein [Protaetiibacter sp.]
MISRRNGTKAALDAGRTVYGTLMSVSSPRLVEFCALGGAECVVFDMEHHPFSLESLEDLVRACEVCDITSIARTNDHSPTAIWRLLSLGFQGIFVPRVETAEEARLLVEATRYPPEGTRGVDLARGSGYGRAVPTVQHVRTANREVLVGITVESARGLAEIDRIVRVEGIDVVNVGAGDLSASMGHGADPAHPAVASAVRRIVESTRERGKAPGTAFADPTQVPGLLQAGYRFLTSSISSVVIDRVGELARTVHGEQGRRSTPTGKGAEK